MKTQGAFPSFQQIRGCESFGIGLGWTFKLNYHSCQIAQINTQIVD
jgi:hypothetical protein